jgi:hypothetical protein
MTRFINSVWKCVATYLLAQTLCLGHLPLKGQHPRLTFDAKVHFLLQIVPMISCQGIKSIECLNHVNTFDTPSVIGQAVVVLFAAS